MIVACFIIGIVLFLDFNVFINADQKYCKSKLQGNDECMYKCHCLYDTQCRRTDGSCGDQTNCSPGWIGPGCQYSNLAYIPKRQNSLLQMDVVRDGNHITCRYNRRFELDLMRAYHISSFTVFANNENTKIVTTALVENSTTEDYNPVNICVESTTMYKQKDFICTHTIFGRYLILQFDDNVNICEIGIHGGRNIALWKETNQSSTFNDNSADRAVDGNVGNYEYSSKSCTHTSGDASQIKPYWEVFFKKEFLVQRLVIYFRYEFGYPHILERASNYSVLLINNGSKIYFLQTHGKPNRTKEFVFQQPVLTTSVKIGLPNKSSRYSPLSLCEVEVFACRLGVDGEVCSNSCPVHCKPRDGQTLCQNFTCPANSCSSTWHGIYCNQKECSKNDLERMNMAINSSFSLLSPCLQGQKINVQCIQGYRRRGSGSITCGKDGNWSNQISCIENTCVLPPEDDHTHFNQTSRTKAVRFGTSIQVSCDPGYKLKIPPVIFCQINGTWNYIWDRLSSVCEENTCNLPPNDDHTDFIHTTGTKTIRFGTSVQVSCDPGYKLKIPPVIFCQLNGTWNYMWDRLSSVCEENTCDLPTDKHVTTNLTKVEAKVSFDTTILISCEEEYKLKGPNVSYCQLNGTWNPGWNKSASLCEGTYNKHLSAVALDVGVGITVFIVILTIIGITFIIKRRKKLNQKTDTNVYDGINEVDESNVYCTIQEGRDEYEIVLATDNTGKVERKKTPKKAIKVEQFTDYFEENKGKIVSQFGNLPTRPQQRPTVVCLQQNEVKYENIYSYDATRVVLNRPKGKSDYIDASFINGFDSLKRYVASQGPTNGTEEDFWEMVYQLNSDKIVMLTNVFEEGEQKCVQYWPDEEFVKHGSMSVHMKTVDRYADLTLRVFSIRQDGKEWRNVRHFQFTSWSDDITPKNAESLIHYRDSVMNTLSNGIGPIIVHCSDGVGRTGVFIALDILVSQARSTRQVDVLSCVESLRHQQAYMVKTVEQYLFLHYVLKEELMSKVTVTSSGDISDYEKVT